MQILNTKRIFRIFSATDWNQPESINFISQHIVLFGLAMTTISLNAGKLRKIASSDDQTALTTKSQNY